MWTLPVHLLDYLIISCFWKSSCKTVKTPCLEYRWSDIVSVHIAELAISWILEKMCSCEELCRSITLPTRLSQSPLNDWRFHPWVSSNAFPSRVIMKSSRSWLPHKVFLHPTQDTLRCRIERASGIKSFTDCCLASGKLIWTTTRPSFGIQRPLLIITLLFDISYKSVLSHGRLLPQRMWLGQRGPVSQELSLAPVFLSPDSTFNTSAQLVSECCSLPIHS